VTMPPPIAGPPLPTRIGPATFRWGERTFVMGILNVTPDSFSGDGMLTGVDGEVDPGDAVALAQGMVEAGADLLDIGGESTRPSHAPVDAEAERSRVVPVIAAIRAALPETPLSIDTTKPAVAEAALAAGADLINDVWGTGPDDTMARVAAAHGVPLVVMHNRAEPIYRSLVAEVLADLERALERALAAGVPEGDLIVDPGIGFGKTLRHNLQILNGLALFHGLGCPILLGASRKRIIGALSNEAPVDQRLGGSVALALHGAQMGVQLLRVHDVPETLQAIRIWRGLRDEALTPG
jgi:dihydropteroate synthase